MKPKLNLKNKRHRRQFQIINGIDAFAFVSNRDLKEFYEIVKKAPEPTLIAKAKSFLFNRKKQGKEYI